VKPLEKERLFDRDIGIFGISVMSGERPRGKTFDNTSRGRTKHGLLYIPEGSVCFRKENGEKISAGPGSLTVLPKNSKYTLCYEGESTSFILVNFDMLDSKGNHTYIFKDITVLFGDITDYRIADTMTKIEECFADSDSVSIFRQKVLMYHLLSIIFDFDDYYENTSPKYANIIPGIRYLKKTYLSNVPISELAAVSNVSVSSFRALFTEKFGMSPIQYRNTLRMKRASALLSDGSYTVAEVARYMGFDNIAYFCRFYKKMTGETPRQTQQKNK